LPGQFDDLYVKVRIIHVLYRWGPPKPALFTSLAIVKCLLGPRRHWKWVQTRIASFSLLMHVVVLKSKWFATLPHWAKRRNKFTAWSGRPTLFSKSAPYWYFSWFMSYEQQALNVIERGTCSSLA